MTGGKNIFSYITKKEKIFDTANALDYFQKSTGVFNQNGMIPQDEVNAMKERVRENKGNLWHGFISFNEENSPKIDTPEKCIAFIKNTFGSFFREAHIDERNIDLMCSLHLDRPHHLHIHFLFWEKEAKYKNAKGEMQYRSKGRIDKRAIDNMFVKSGIFVSEGKDRLHKSRQDALKELRGMTAVNVAMTTSEEIKTEILALAKDLPKTGRLSYGSKDMESYRGRVDNIVKLLLAYDGTARKADKRFYRELEKRKAVIENICGRPYAFSDRNVSENVLEQDLPKYHHQIDSENIKIISEIEADYRRRQGNLVLGLAKFIKPEYYERKSGKKYQANDTRLKKRLSISQKKVSRSIQKFLSSFGGESELLERDFTHRLSDIEEEIKREREKTTRKEKRENEKEENYKE